MRKFGIDSPELMQFTLGDSDRVYAIPLAASMPLEMLIKMSDAKDDTELFNAQINMLRKYMGDIVLSLTGKTVREITAAWYEESNKAGAEVGESSALPASSEGMPSNMI